MYAAQQKVNFRKSASARRLARALRAKGRFYIFSFGHAGPNFVGCKSSLGRQGIPKREIWKPATKKGWQMKDHRDGRGTEEVYIYHSIMARQRAPRILGLSKTRSCYVDFKNRVLAPAHYCRGFLKKSRTRPTARVRGSALRMLGEFTPRPT